MTDPQSSEAPAAQPILSVIIPVYNDGAVAVNAVRAVIASAEKNNISNIEILCVEGGSTDDSAALIQEVCASEPRARLVVCPSGAVAPKFNLGARHASADWLAFTESDCLPDTGWLAAWKRVIDDGRWNACAGRVIAYSDDPNLQLSIRDSLERKEVTPGLLSKALSFYHGQGNNFLIRKQLFIDVGGADERLGAGAPGRSGQDAELNFRLLSAGETIGYEPDALVVHYPRETRDSFLRKKKNYYYAGVWWILVIHPCALSGWLALALRFIYPPLTGLFALLTFNISRGRQRWEEWKGFFSGVRDALTYRSEQSRKRRSLHDADEQG
ncbi:MAG: glycosyltransferase [Planctomycetota bacterium]